jgi:pimeloyl-ACP methyl ester carboxylesterase
MRRRWKIPLAILGLLLVLLALNTIVVDSETKSAEVNVDEGRIVETSGGEVQVREDGPSDGPPIVLLHCYACSLRWWDNMVPVLAERNRVIRLDLIGFGGSEKPKSGYAITEEANAVASVLAELGVQDATVVGHSLGFDVAVALTEQSPELVAQLVDIDEAPDESDAYFDGLPFAAQAGFAPVIGQAIWRVTPDFAIRDGVKGELFAPDYSLAAGFEDPDQVVEDFEAMTYTSFKESDDYVEETPLDERLAELEKPVLVIFGSEDEVYDVGPSLEAYADIPGATTAVIGGAGHSPNVEKPIETANLILEFAAERSPKEKDGDKGDTKKKSDGKGASKGR